jgi:chlorobactene glucosyltransferase
MTLALIFLFVTAILELELIMNSLLVRRWATDGLSTLLAFSTGYLLYIAWGPVTIAVAVLMIYRLINLERLTHRKLQDDYVNHLARRASLVLIGLQAALLCLLAVQPWLSISADNWLLGLAVLDLMAAGVLAHTIDNQGRATVAPRAVSSRAELDLPTLTVAIPARNETADLEACLQTLTHSSYLKLEILVLDDCSQNAHTPEIIRQFAHDGVRFIAGSPPPDNWLAKNQAYEQLAQEANGDLILFCGVDARFEPDSLRKIVETMLDKHKSMLSVMPRNFVPGRFKLEALMVQPGRYAWELVLPRRWLDRPPVLSSCWLVQRQLLIDAGGLAAVHRAIVPERYFARYAATHNDGYSFVQSGEQLGLASAKSFNEQRATAVRIRYPGLHRRVELTVLVSLLELMVLAAPFVSLVGSLVYRHWIVAALNAVACALLSYVYYQVVRMTYQRPLVRGLWLLPFATVYDVGLLNYSMWQYEFSQVIWKGRNVCIPVMRVIAHLPPLEPAPYNHRPGRRHHRNRHHRR